eukprot:TRINITY_DN14607_c0_g1_i1.p1 TRINITY_DN14607_c0_g1~~TRINITY_DN14607_c0_g1_i1.p1  ORF type:complete len:159 (-),score=13.90 TRINITY_DN14607_c0_g1_i1:34-510(-)
MKVAEHENVNSRFASIDKFNLTINGLTLAFKEDEVERKYQSIRTNLVILNPALKWALIVLGLILVCRRAELLILNVFDVDSISSSISDELVQFCLMIVAGLIELLCICVNSFKVCKSFFAVLFVFFTVIFSSSKYVANIPSSVPIGIPMYMGLSLIPI